MPDVLSLPRYAQSDVLAVTRLRAATLQTWINRNVIQLSDQNPGYGRRRQYSALDVVKLAVMRRIADLRIDLPVGVALAEEAAAKLLKEGEFPWDLHLTIRPQIEKEATGHEITFIYSSKSAFAPHSPTHGDTRNMRVSDLTEPFESVLSRRVRPTIEERLQGVGDDRPIDPARREILARQGTHAEPAIIFPIGEIVNGALAQLRTCDEKTK